MISLISVQILAVPGTRFRRIPDDLGDFREPLPDRDVDRSLLLLVLDGDVGAVDLHQDPDQLPAAHGGRDVDRRVAVLERKDKIFNFQLTLTQKSGSASLGSSLGTSGRFKVNSAY